MRRRLKRNPLKVPLMLQVRLIDYLQQVLGAFFSFTDYPSKLRAQGSGDESSHLLKPPARPTWVYT